MGASFTMSGDNTIAMFQTMGQKIAQKFLERVIPRTPVADTNGGALREAWVIVENADGTYSIVNNADYAGFVNNGHMTRGGKSFVQPVAFVEATLAELEQIMAEILSGV